VKKVGGLCLNLGEGRLVCVLGGERTKIGVVEDDTDMFLCLSPTKGSFLFRPGCRYYSFV